MLQWWQYNGSSNVAIHGFHLFTQDRQTESEKKKGGCACIYVNQKWCHTKKYVAAVHTLHAHWPVSAQPYYLPPEFTHVLVVCVYIPPSANDKEAADQIASHVHNQIPVPPTVKVVMRRFNYCDIKKVLAAYQQQVTCQTHEDNTTDKCSATAGHKNCTKLDCWSTRSPQGLFWMYWVDKFHRLGNWCQPYSHSHIIFVLTVWCWNRQWKSTRTISHGW